MIINLNNVDNVIFLNNKLRSKLKDLNHILLSWDVANRIPGLDNIKKTARLDLLNALQENHKNILKNEFNEDVVIEKINYNTIKNYNYNIDDIFDLNEKGFYNFCVARNKDSFQITFWR